MAKSAASAACPVPQAARVTKWKSNHLWLCLLALGFQPKSYLGVRLGRNMFAKPNSTAFSSIACFLFTKLDKHRARQTFRLSGFTKQPSPRFRKHCWMWLREISKLKGIGLPQIAHSTLICPAGAKVVHLIYCFARYVMIEEMKKLSLGTGIPFAEAVMRTPMNMYITKARHRVAYNKLLQVLQWEDFLFEYREKAQILIREIQQAKSDYDILWMQSCRMKQNDQNKNDTTERIQKVRSMWTLIVETLTSLKKEKEAVDSVLEDCVNPCILDGTDVVLHVPQLLIYTVETNKYGLCTGCLYEDGKLNFLTVIQLLNEALMTLRDEHCLFELKTLHRVEDLVAFCKKVQELNTKRKQQHCEPNLESVSREEEIWESTWRMALGSSPLNLVFKDDQQFFKASSLQFFSSSDEDEDTTFCESFSDDYESYEACHGKNDGTLDTTKDTPLVVSKCDLLSSFLRCSSIPLSSEASENGDLLIENDLHTCVGNNPVPPKILKNGKEEFPSSETEENAGENVTQPKFPVKKDDLLEKARDELAEEIAKSVCESTDSDEEKGMALDDLISSLSFNPFLTGKQLPRTPENLLAETRSSWRKGIQTEGSLDLELASTEVVTEESSMNAPPSMQEEVDSTSVCSEHASPVPDLGPPVSQNKSQLSSTESSSQEQVTISHTFESSDSKTSGIQENERTDSEELDGSAWSGSSVEDLSQTLQNLNMSMNTLDTCLKSGSRTNTLPSDHCRSFLMNEMLCQNVSALNFVSHETTDVEIINETLPEYDSDLSISAGSGSIFFGMNSENSMDDSENDEDIKKLDLDIQCLSNSHEVLKKTASESEEELHQTHNGDKCGSCRAELTVIPGEENCDDPLMDKTPLASSNESKYSLSPLLVSCQQMDGI